MRFDLLFAGLLSAVTLALVPQVRAKYVFAHYLVRLMAPVFVLYLTIFTKVGTVTQEHVQTDINDALFVPLLPRNSVD